MVDCFCSSPRLRGTLRFGSCVCVCPVQQYEVISVLFKCWLAAESAAASRTCSVCRSSGLMGPDTVRRVEVGGFMVHVRQRTLTCVFMIISLTSHLLVFQMNIIAGGFYDGLMLYSHALNETMSLSGGRPPGRNVTKRMWNRTFHGWCFF